jgi:hypothetical protein
MKRKNSKEVRKMKQEVILEGRSIRRDDNIYGLRAPSAIARKEEALAIAKANNCPVRFVSLAGNRYIVFPSGKTILIDNLL